jgi:phosphoglycerol transferase
VLNLATAGPHREELTSGPAASEVFGLKIRQLVTPIRGHWFSPFRAWAEKEAEAHFPNGFNDDRLGLVSTVGFLGLLVVFFVPSVAGHGDAAETTRAASRLTVAGILFATVAGFASLVSLLISPAVNDLSGMTPFLMFFALTGLALAVDRITDGPARRRWRGVAWTSVLVLGLLDQSVATIPVRGDRMRIHDEVKQLRAFVSGLEDALPAGAMVLQVPVRPETDVRGTTRMRTFDNFKPWLISRTLRWSSPDGFGEHAGWLADVTGVPATDMPAHFRREGFSAIVVDRNGFRDGGAAVLDALQAGPQPARPVKQDARYVALDIR